MKASIVLAVCQTLLVLCQFVIGQSHDELYILIDEVSVFNCKGVRNEIKITEDDIDIVNERGNKVYYIRAPGNYTIDFRKITVKEDFGHLAGEIGITLQVPIIEGPAGIRFDLPYTMVPETTLLSQKCDAHSGIVEKNGRQYCRYCDLCGISNAVEGELNRSGHQFLSGGQQEENPLQPACGNIERNSYNFRRTISLPSRRTLEGMIKDKVQGVDGEIKKRLNKGRGRFQVFLNLISAEKAPISQHRWFAQSRECACCLNPRSRECSSLSFLYCNIEECKSAWAQMCLHNTARIVACYTVEFNYRMTTSYAEVQRFLDEKGLSDPNREQQQLTRKVITPPRLQQHRYIPSSSSSVFNQPTVLSAQQHLREVQQSRYPQQRQQRQQQFAAQQTDDRSPVREEESEGTLSDRCVALMPARLQHLRRYCTIFWNAKLCCSHCEGVC
ncbi:hypothetical protein PMAYCL1PPCAC_27992 [Pristionchus mayeri]|uniref:Uncharacterized protein n=1 Tax=Pristionchus mayeri TaxID=1317129 RepID=A0AAN5D852_9BILA|nr:hypothetical protein PMAYCL1PPCAC_27992 [Pristionchus mayeri]